MVAGEGGLGGVDLRWRTSEDPAGGGVVDVGGDGVRVKLSKNSLGVGDDAVSHPVSKFVAVSL